MSRSTRVSILIEAVALGLAIFVSVSPLLEGVGLSLDSTNFIVAAQNLVDQGAFHVNTNWPSKSLSPSSEPFTDYPPGYAIYLVPFLLATKDPFLAAAWAQACSVLVCFGGLAYLLWTIRPTLSLRVGGYLLFAMLANFPIIYQYFLTESLFLGLSFMGGAFALRLGSDRSTRVTTCLAALCFFLASSIKVVGVFNFAWFLVPLIQHRPFRWRLAVGMVGVCTIPLIIWFARNLVVHGRISFSHRIGETHLWDELLIPLKVITHDLIPVFERPWTGPFVLTTLCFILLAPLTVLKATRSEVANVRSDEKRSIHLTLVLVLSAHFFGIWALSLVSHFSALDDRLLSPSIAFAVIAGLSGLDRIGQVSSVTGRTIAHFAPFAYIFVGMHITAPRVVVNDSRFTYPPEAELWDRIDSVGISVGASHYYSDYDFRHQIYSPLPHRILWDTTDYGSQEAIKELAFTGTRPFFIFDTTSAEFEVFERAWRTDRDPLLRPYPIEGFVVYHHTLRPVQ